MKYSSLESIIDFAWASGADINLVNDAKKEYTSLLEKNKDISLIEPVAYAQTNEHGDLFNLRLQNNPYSDQSKIIPLYRLS